MNSQEDLAGRLARAEWIWMPHPGHLMISRECNFRLTTWVPGHENDGFIVSTVGEWKRSPYDSDEGFLDVSYGYIYQTSVFAARKSNVECCPYLPNLHKEFEGKGYNDPGDAFKGHLEMCEKWQLSYYEEFDVRELRVTDEGFEAGVEKYED